MDWREEKGGEGMGANEHLIKQGVQDPLVDGTRNRGLSVSSKILESHRTINIKS